MATVAEIERPRQSSRTLIPALENGDRLAASEFLRRYETMEGVKKAELVNGIVYMPSPVRFDQHGEPEGFLQGWVFTYRARTPGVRHAPNTTARLGADDVPQPDIMLLLDPKCGGRTRTDEKGYLTGSPELVIEVAASSASLDATEKLNSYRRAGVREYLIYRTLDAAVDWYALEADEYRRLPTDAEGVIRSRVFPGLWLDVNALVSGDILKLTACLERGISAQEYQAFTTNLREALAK